MKTNDLICEMDVAESKAKYKSEFVGATYYFCSPACKLELDKNP